MGFSIHIGNGEMQPVDHPTKYARVIRSTNVYYDVIVKKVKRPEAPVFVGDIFTQNSNSRYPDCCDWSDLCRKAGLIDLFFGEQGLTREHGFQDLHFHHTVAIQNALSDWKARHPDTVPGFGTSYDDILARLEWLNWWVQWALTNCEHAGIYNR